MPPHERFSRFLFGVLLLGSFFFVWGKWVAVALGVLFVVSSLHGLCLGCKCKQALNNTINQKDKS